MKHTAKLILCLSLVLCALLSFGACKKKDSTPAASTVLPTDTASIYYLSGVTYGEEIYTTDQLLISDPALTYIFFDTDGNGILSIDSFETYFQYADGQLWDEIDPDTKVNYSINGNALTLEQDGYKMVFTRGELPDWAIVEEDIEEEFSEDVLTDEDFG